MNTSKIQTLLDAMIQPMLDKGLVKPEAYFRVQSQAVPALVLSWVKSEAIQDWDRKYEYAKGDTLEEKFAAASAFIAALPSKDETRLRNFMEALGKVIDQGRETGIEVSFVNPLVETMKKLSENALTYQKVAAE